MRRETGLWNNGHQQALLSRLVHRVRHLRKQARETPTHSSEREPILQKKCLTAECEGNDKAVDMDVKETCMITFD